MKKYSDPLNVTIAELHEDGYGLADSINGRLAIPGTLAGEAVLVRPMKRKKGLRQAELLSVSQAAPQRVSPDCSVAGRCGGCSFQHFESEAQILFKQSRLLRLLDGLNPEKILPAIRSVSSGYRVKARLGVKFVLKKDRVMVGFREKQGGYITDMSHCSVLAPPFGDLIEEFAELIGSLSAPAAIPQLELARGDEVAAVIIRHLSPLTDDDCSKLRVFGEEHALHIYLQPDDLNSVWKLYPESGEERLYYDLVDHHLSFSFHPLDFVQVNPAVNRQLIDRVLSLLAINKDDRVLDLFCGIGNFSLPMARRAETVHGLDSSASGIARAIENANKNHVVNATFAIEDLFFGKRIAKEASAVKPLFTGYNKVLVDPPRTGALEVMNGLVNSQVERVVYVSCHPESLARDASVLCSGGRFHLVSTGVVDMFPQTAHVESIACFVRS